LKKKSTAFWYFCPIFEPCIVLSIPSTVHKSSLVHTRLAEFKLMYANRVDDVSFTEELRVVCFLLYIVDFQFGSWKLLFPWWKTTEAEKINTIAFSCKWIMDASNSNNVYSYLITSSCSTNSYLNQKL